MNGWGSFSCSRETSWRLRHMKILLDESVWPGLWVHLGPHAVESVARTGWG